MRRTSVALAPAALLAATAAFAQAPARQAPPEGDAPKPFTLPATESFTLPNGLGVTLVPYGIVPKVRVHLAVDAANADETARQVWLADLTGELLKEGTTTRTAQAVAESLASMGGSLDVGVGGDSTSISTDVLSEYAAEAVAVLADSPSGRRCLPRSCRG